MPNRRSFLKRTMALAGAALGLPVAGAAADYDSMSPLLLGKAGPLDVLKSPRINPDLWEAVRGYERMFERNLGVNELLCGRSTTKGTGNTEENYDA